MATNCLTLCFLLICLLPLASASNPNHREHHPKHVEAIYVFGDSLYDSGNDIHIKTNATAKFLPFGIDFGGKPTGRCTNGKTVVDYIAILLGLPFVPPYLGLTDHQRDKIKTGINYAAAGSGILPETCPSCLALDIQIELFNRTVTNNLPKMFKNQAQLARHLSKSLFVFNTGVNDYGHNSQKASKDPGAFALNLLNEFSIRLQKLYSIGARKYLVNNIPPAGCFPSSAARMKPRGKCDEKKNKMITLYNRRLPTLLNQLTSQLPGFVFVHSDLYKFLLEMRRNANKYGILYTWEPCCPNNVDGDLSCHPNSVPCKDRNAHLFFDIHPSQITNYIFVGCCFNESTICRPLSLKQFVEGQF
ncbi:hypothetical protein L6164_001866 [Bauhinia variegata]|uniref:Uncharacterized protein n=1 Tax=Bauhinia variegata TaxID=167791 RepID=A0ACB9QCB9_BAUVA|nr:hypothetical protein L6164_001866 [Bauhinia variegata]